MKYRFFLGAVVALALSPFIAAVSADCNCGRPGAPAPSYSTDVSAPRTLRTLPTCEAAAPQAPSCTTTVPTAPAETCFVCKCRPSLTDHLASARSKLACSVCTTANKAHCALTRLHDAGVEARCKVSNTLAERRASRRAMCCCIMHCHQQCDDCCN